jgi:hypothetical protein
MSKKKSVSPEQIKQKNDNIIEWQFIKDYGKFALGMNFRAGVALIKEARTCVDAVQRKSLCLSGLQLFYSSAEDFAILLEAFCRRANDGKHLHLSIGVEDRGRQGTTFVPAITKRFVSARQWLDDVGLRKITYERISKVTTYTREQFEDKYRDYANGLREMGLMQEDFNIHKNKLKHGKPVLSKLKGHATLTEDQVVFLRWVPDKTSGDWKLELRIVEASLQHFEAAFRNIAQLYIISLDLLWQYLLNYLPQNHEDFMRNVLIPCSETSVEQVRKLGVSTKGLE